MSINRPDDGESYADFKARRAAWMRDYRARGCKHDPDDAEACEAIAKLGYVPLVPTKMVLTDWTTDEHGNRSRQAIGM